MEFKGGLFKAVGAPTEAALVVLAEKIGLANAAEQQAVENARRAEPDKNFDAATRVYTSKCGSALILEFHPQGYLNTRILVTHAPELELTKEQRTFVPGRSITS